MYSSKLITITLFCLTLSAPAQDAGWTRISPTVTSAGGEVFEIASTSEVVVSGPLPESSLFEVMLALAPGSGVTALRLEALAHEALPQRGPGRAANGHAVLTEVEASFAPGTTRRFSPVAFRQVDSDDARWNGSQPDGHHRVIDGVKGTKTGWVIDGSGAHRDRCLYLVPAQTLGARTGGTLRIKMHFDSGWPGHTLGRFRWSATDATQPAKLLPKPPSVAAASVDAAIDKGVAWLLAQQAVDGSWLGPESNYVRSGMTGLAVYTLIKCGLPRDHPAVRAAVAWISKEKPERTYDIGCTLLALAEAGEPESKPLIASLAAKLVRSMGGGPGVAPGEWGYPGSLGDMTAVHADLSNTQYALLGLRAAARAGEPVPERVWSTVIEWITDRQESYGGFGYTKGSRATSSMTAAGSGCLLIAAQGLAELTKVEGPSVLRARGGAKRGMGWLKDHWSVQQNVEGAFDAGKQLDRWYFYWMYGLERVGSLSGERLIGEHDWYQEGATEIVRRQNANGHWNMGGYGEADSNTCFALLFLRRGSGVTQPPPRAGASAGDVGSIQISAGTEWPAAFWVRAVSAGVVDRVARGEKVAGVRWFVDGAEVAFVKPSVADVRSDSFSTRWSGERNGQFKVKAVLEFEGGAGAARPESSVELPLTLDSVPLKRHAEARRDSRTNLLRAQYATVAASSEAGGHSAGLVLDGRHTTMWICDEKDTQPTLTVRISRPVQCSVIKLGVPRRYMGNSRTEFSRPRSVQLKINNEAPILVELADDVDRKHAISFPKTSVRSIKLTILSTYGGEKSQTGWQEVELFAATNPDDASYVEQGVIDVVVPAGRDKAKILWRWTTTDPGAGWETAAFKDMGWKESPVPFGDLPAGKVAGRTGWAVPEIWLRKSVTLGPTTTGRWRMEVLADDTAIVFVNGVLAAEVDYTNDNYVSVDLSPEAAATLKPGANLIAIHALNSGGPGAIDFALRRISEPGK